MVPAHAADVRIGIDVGSTFTDFVLLDAGRARLMHYKQPSTPDDPARAVIEGLAVLLDATGVSPVRVGLLVHGTTIALNAVIQRRVARVVLAVTEGFRDVLEIGRSRMPFSFDFHARKEVPLLPRDQVVEIGARLNAKGEPSRVPEEAELAQLARRVRALAPDAVALMLVNGYANPSFELALAERLATWLNGIPVCSAAWLWPEIREYERTLLACMNAGIQPLMQRYYDELRERLDQLGLAAPLFVTASNGGSLSLASARARPVETLLSGPASGVTAAVRVAADAGVARIISLDMGGTSSDISISIDSEPEFATRTEIGGLPLVLPVVAIDAIGAGGGSIVWVDAHGVLKVGPESAGADPGPMCYGRGGRQPTVTDCYLLAGFLHQDRFLGGRLRLYRRAAEESLVRLAERLGVTGPDAATRLAWDALRVATAGMAVKILRSLAQRGLDPAEFTLMPFGGAGPTHAAMLAAEAAIPRILVPREAATFCALGAVSADLRRDFVRSLRVRLDPTSATALVRQFAALEAEARGWLAGEGAFAESVELYPAVDMRYAGQAYELRVPLSRLEEAQNAASLRAAFHAAHEQLYGFHDESAEIGLGTARLAIVGRVPQGARPTFAAPAASPAPPERRQVFLGDDWQNVPVFDRDALPAGFTARGPAIVEQADTVTVILPGWTLVVDAFGNLRLAGAGA
jgi:N-methylhydantoinase A